jgi:hypothetical protein
MRQVRFQVGNRIRALRLGARMFPSGFVLAGAMGVLVLVAIGVSLVLFIAVA